MLYQIRTMIEILDMNNWIWLFNLLRN